VQLLKTPGQNGEALADVIVKLSRNAAAFFFLGFNQPAAQSCDSLVRQFALSYVLSRTTQPDDRSCSITDCFATGRDPSCRAIWADHFHI
jgi:hypothetical protein